MVLVLMPALCSEFNSDRFNQIGLRLPVILKIKLFVVYLSTQ